MARPPASGPPRVAIIGYDRRRSAVLSPAPPLVGGGGGGWSPAGSFPWKRTPPPDHRAVAGRHARRRRGAPPPPPPQSGPMSLNGRISPPESGCAIVNNLPHRRPARCSLPHHMGRRQVGNNSGEVRRAVRGSCGRLFSSTSGADSGGETPQGETCPSGHRRSSVGPSLLRRRRPLSVGSSPAGELSRLLTCTPNVHYKIC